jgi:transposase
MRTQEEKQLLRERAIELRLAGKSVREIQQALGPVGKRALHEALQGVAPAEWTKRPNAKDDLRAKARELRLQGMYYDDIAAELHVSKSTLSLWLRDLPRPLTDAEDRQRRTEVARKRWLTEQPRRDAQRAAKREAAAAEIGTLSDREVLIAGAIAYWCEGSKSKPYQRRERVIFMNSDPGLIRFFLRFLDAAGVSRADLKFSVSIHESADVQSGHLFWQEITGAAPEQFNKPVIKRHNPLTVRKNVGDTYHGCLRVEVRRSSELYRKIEGWASAAMTAA